MARDILTKVIALTSILDDIYDVYGTLKELVLITEAIQNYIIRIPFPKLLNLINFVQSQVCHFSVFEFRWDVDAMDVLPEFMQAYYKELLHLYEEIGNEVATKGRSYRLVYAKQTMGIIDTLYMHRKHFLLRNITFLLMSNFLDEEAIKNVLSGSQMVPYQLHTNTGGVHAPSTNNDWLWNVLATTSLMGMGDAVIKHAFEWS